MMIFDKLEYIPTDIINNNLSETVSNNANTINYFSINYLSNIF